ncbi:MAG: 3-phosphoshikimate 1-carboxyvinyltransferase, partial [Candidatus Eremiobacteraeota bacterium]|nr:3-phosphoshikimate 1-carboxyvinyltransferase [Candidatus Eremiobacteraeota bacterium]
TWNNESVADIVVEAASLRGASLGSDVALRALDEIPVLAVAAACANGTTRISGVRRLREKESDRLATIAHMLQAVGIACEVGADDISITGNAGAHIEQPATIATEGDHRITMSAAPLAAAMGPIEIDDAAAADVSFPNFAAVWAAGQR